MNPFQPLNVYKAQNNANYWTVFMSVSSVAAAPHSAPLGGGILKNIVVHPPCCKLCVLCSTAVTAPASSVSKVCKIPSACSAVTASATALGSALKDSTPWAPLAACALS